MPGTELCVSRFYSIASSLVPCKADDVMLIFQSRTLRLRGEMNCPRSSTSQIPTLALPSFLRVRVTVSDGQGSLGKMISWRDEEHHFCLVLLPPSPRGVRTQNRRDGPAWLRGSHRVERSLESSRWFWPAPLGISIGKNQQTAYKTVFNDTCIDVSRNTCVVVEILLKYQEGVTWPDFYS